MIDFICPKCKAERSVNKIVTKVIEGKVRHDVQCEKCEEYMDLKNPKSGFPNFSSNSMGQL